MYRRNPVRAVTIGLTGGIILIGLAVAFLSGHFLPVFFIALAIASLLGSIGSLRQNGIYGGLHSFVWLLGLAFCFAFGFWPWILFVVGASIILGALRVPIMAAFAGTGHLRVSIYGKPAATTSLPTLSTTLPAATTALPTGISRRWTAISEPTSTIPTRILRVSAACPT